MEKSTSYEAPHYAVMFQVPLISVSRSLIMLFAYPLEKRWDWYMFSVVHAGYVEINAPHIWDF
jgi:hypothetical protein